MFRHRTVWMFLPLLVVTCSCQSFNFSSVCCPNGTIQLSEATACVASTNITLYSTKINIDCTSSGYYILDPNEFSDDKFIENDKGDLRILSERMEALTPAGRWCTYTEDSSEEPKALVCFSDDIERPANIMYLVYGTCLLISVMCMVLTLVVYFVLPEMRDLQGKCLMANIGCLALGYVTLATVQFHGSTMHSTFCVISAFVIYFCLLSAFFWLNVVSFNVWRNVMLQDRGRRYVREEHLFGIYCTYAWGVPLLYLVASLTTHFAPVDWHILKPNFGRSKCWFDDRLETWVYFYGPIALLLSFNLLFFTSTAYTLWRASSENASRIRSHRLKCLLYLKLFFVMGITWIFEVLSYAHGEMTWFWYTFDILNCLQGVLIFIIMVFRKRTLRAIASRKWGAAMCPNQHHTLLGGVDEEESEASVAEEVELARPHVPNTVTGS